MTKIGRNDPCYCGSGKKFKKCCYGKPLDPALTPAPAPEGSPPSVNLRSEILKTQDMAAEKKNTLRTLGVFIFLSTESGDGWLLEITAMDALPVARGGEKLAFELEETPETIEINWPYRFSFKDKKFVVTSYKDKTETVYPEYPAARIRTILRKERDKIPPDLLAQLHIDSEEEAL